MPYKLTVYHEKLVSKCVLFTSEETGMAPVFDNNRSLFPELDEDQLASPKWYMEKCRPRLGRDFIVTARGLLTPGIREDLEALHGFQFAGHPAINISGKRLELLGAIVNLQLETILE